MGKAFKDVTPAVTGIATVVALNTMHNFITLYQGKLSPEQFTESCIRDVFVISCGVLGASTFQTILPIPLLGVLVGNFIGVLLNMARYLSHTEVFCKETNKNFDEMKKCVV
ncbi:MAG: hypothetical protein E3K32_08870 [wastewater metagenome]|nr:hypothetical protein [Candidatus Loosdrechtia aerotolerans]